MDSGKDLSRRRARKALGLLIGGVLAGAGMGLALWWLAPAAGDISAERPFICAQTGRSFRAKVRAGMLPPIRSPHSGKDTGYPAEMCYWNSDGTARTQPTAVLLNSYVGRPEPTFCPECGRRVVAHNPRPNGTCRPPPTAQECEREED